MDLHNYLLIDDPLERLRVINEKIRVNQAEIINLSPVRNAALIECHEAGIDPKVICETAGFTMARMRNIFREINYKPKVSYAYKRKATQFKPVSEY